MEKQTAVQWAINEIAVKWHYIESGEVLLSDIMDKAMEMEKQQIIKDYDMKLSMMLDNFNKVKDGLSLVSKEYEDMFVGKYNESEELEILGVELKDMKKEFDELFEKFEYGVNSDEFIKILGEEQRQKSVITSVKKL